MGLFINKPLVMIHRLCLFSGTYSMIILPIFLSGTKYYLYTYRSHIYSSLVSTLFIALLTI